MRIFLGFVLVLWLVGCQSEPEPPVWYFEPPKLSHSQHNLYGYGSAEDENLAKMRALEDIRSQLALSLQTQIQRGRYDDFADFKPANIVPQIELDNAHVRFANVAYKQGVYYIRAEIPKKIIIQSLQKSYQWALRHTSAEPSCAAPKGAGTKGDARVIQSALLLQALGENPPALPEKEPRVATMSLYLAVNDLLYAEMVRKALDEALRDFYELTDSAPNTMRADVKIEHGTKGSVMQALVLVRDCQGKVAKEWQLSAVHSSRGPYENTRYNARQIAKDLRAKLQEWADSK